MTRLGMTARKFLGFLIAISGIALGAFLTGVTAILVTGYWTGEHPGTGNRPVLIAAAAIGALIGYGLYRLGRRIGR
jgi:hypothetical protein